MTERLLLLRTASTERYVVLGTDYPCARVFSSTSSSLVAVLQPSKKSDAHAAIAVTLTCVAIGACTTQRRRTPQHSSTPLIESSYAAAGLSNGTVLLHHIEGNEALGEVLVSPTQQPVQSLSLCGGFLWSLGADQKVSLVSLRYPEDGVCFQFNAQLNATAIAVTQRRRAAEGEAGGVEDVFDVLVAGSTTALFTVVVHPAAATKKRSGGNGLFRVEKGISFASQGTAVSFAWLSAPKDRRVDGGAMPWGRAAVTASAADSTIRLWDVESEQEQAESGTRSTEGAATLFARCRRTLVCGQRIADVSVLEGKTSCFLSATTFTGAVLLWDLGTTLLPRVAEPLPLHPDIILYSAAAVGRLLLCHLLPFSSEEGREDRNRLSLRVVRGRFALPCFEQVLVGKLPSHVSSVSRPQQHRAKLSLLASLAITSSSAVVLKEVPLSVALRESLELQDSVLDKASAGRGGEAGAFDALDNVWAKQQVVAVATKASLTPTEAFPLAKAHRAVSTAALPVRSVTLEQRLRQVAKENAVEGGEGDGHFGSAAGTPQSLGLATVPLYQALHANDVAAVMELLSVASRSPEGMRATVMSLELPYALQLLGIISERLGICSRHVATGSHSSATTVVGGGIGAVSSRSPLLQWIDAIVHYRGMEMYAAQRAFDAPSFSASADDAPADVAASPPKDFIAPILHQYRRMTKMSDALATLHGRLGAFLGVRPSEKNRFVNRSRKMLGSNLDIGTTPMSASSGVLQNDIVFPAMFAEVESRKKGNYTVRVRSKAAAALSKRKKLTKDVELLRQAKQRAAQDLKGKGKPGLLDNEEDSVWDDVLMEQMAAGDEEGLLEQLEAMDALDSEDSEEEPSLSDLEEEGSKSQRKGKGSAGLKKRQRVETDEVLPQEASDDEDEAVHSGSSGDEFSEGSDEKLDSGSSAEDEEGSSSSEEEDDSSGGEDGEGEHLSSHSHSEGEDDDGMGEDMQELLEQAGTTGAANARDKRVRVD